MKHNIPITKVETWETKEKALTESIHEHKIKEVGQVWIWSEPKCVLCGMSPMDYPHNCEYTPVRSWKPSRALIWVIQAHMVINWFVVLCMLLYVALILFPVTGTVIHFYLAAGIGLGMGYGSIKVGEWTQEIKNKLTK